MGKDLSGDLDLSTKDVGMIGLCIWEWKSTCFQLRGFFSWLNLFYIGNFQSTIPSGASLNGRMQCRDMLHRHCVPITKKPNATQIIIANLQAIYPHIVPVYIYISYFPICILYIRHSFIV